MGFADARIKHDIETLTMPVKLKLDGKTLIFTLDIQSPLYNRSLDFKVTYPDGYPFKSPKLMCLSKIYHPNIDLEGNVCLKVLREGWSPAFDLNSILISLLLAFHEPSGEDALNVEAGILLENNLSEFKKKVNEYI